MRSSSLVWLLLHICLPSFFISFPLDHSNATPWCVLPLSWVATDRDIFQEKYQGVTPLGMYLSPVKTQNPSTSFIDTCIRIYTTPCYMVSLAKVVMDRCGQLSFFARENPYMELTTLRGNTILSYPLCHIASCSHHPTMTFIISIFISTW